MGIVAQKKSFTEQELLETAGKAFWNMVSHYELTQAEAAVLLGISEKNCTRLGELSGIKAIPPETLVRVSHLLGIHKSLRIIYPENREVVYGWMKKPQGDLGGKTPLEYVSSQAPSLREFAIADLRGRLDRERISGPF